MAERQKESSNVVLSVGQPATGFVGENTSFPMRVTSVDHDFVWFTFASSKDAETRSVTTGESLDVEIEFAGKTFAIESAIAETKLTTTGVEFAIARPKSWGLPTGTDEDEDVPPQHVPTSPTDVALEVGQLAFVRLKNGNGGESLPCLVASFDQDLVWLTVHGSEDAVRRPPINQEVEIMLDYGTLALTTSTVVVSKKFTRRGLAFAIPYPKIWRPRTERGDVRIPVSIQARGLRKKDAAAGVSATFSVMIADISVNGARVQSRASLQRDEPLLIMFQLPTVQRELAIVARVARVSSGYSEARLSHEAGLEFLKMDDSVREELSSWAAKVSLRLQARMRSEVEERAKTLQEVQLQLIGHVQSGDSCRLEVEGVDKHMVEALLNEF